MNFEKFKDVLKRPKEQSAQTEGDKKKEADIALVRDLYNKFRVARMAKEPKTTIWDKCISAYNSEYFKNMNKPDYKSDEISNFIFSTIETIKPIMVDNDPKIIILPKSPEGMMVVDKIQNIFDSEWTRSKMGKKLTQAITVALQIGTCPLMVRWNGREDNGLGNVEIVLINPYNFFPDPMATDIDNAEYIIYASYKHVTQLKSAFPSKASLLEGGTINYSELVSQGTDTSNVSNQVLVLECWTRDYTTFDTEAEDPDDSTKKVKVRKSKYPKGRIITIAPELDLILDDKQNPYDDGKFPFHLLKCYDVPFEFWGKSEVEQLLSPQTYINDLMNQIIDNAKLTANMPWVLDKNSGIGKGQLTNRPGLIVRKNPGTDVKRLTPPQMPVYVQEIIETLKRDVEIISGVHDVTQGRKPGSVSAASAIMALQEAAQARIRLKVKLMELTLGELGQMWYNRIKQFWVTARWIRKNDAVQNFNPQMTPDQAFTTINPQDLQFDIDFIISAGSTMPQNKNAMLDLMIRLAQTVAEDGMPMVDRDTVLTYTNVPDRKKLVQRFAELSGQRQQQAQQQQVEGMAQQQMMAEHQASLDTEVTEPSDAQLQMIIEMLVKDPKMMQQVQQAMATQNINT